MASDWRSLPVDRSHIAPHFPRVLDWPRLSCRGKTGEWRVCAHATSCPSRMRARRSIMHAAGFRHTGRRPRCCCCAFTLLCCLALRVHVLCAQQRQHVRHRHGRQLPSSSSLGYLAGPCQAPSASWQAPRLSSRAYCSPADPTRASGSKASRPQAWLPADFILRSDSIPLLPVRGPPSVCK